MTVTPPVGLWDQPRTIVILHLSPGQVVTVNARTPRQAGIWTASATFKANDRGVVDLARDAPITGSYEGISPMGLFWSQHEVGTASATSHSRVTTLTVSAGTRQIASATVTQLLRGPGVAERAETVSKVGFSGVYFASSGSARRPAVVAWAAQRAVLSTRFRGPRCSPHTAFQRSRWRISTDRGCRARSTTSRWSTSSKRSRGCAANPRSTPPVCGSSADRAAPRPSCSSPRTGRGSLTASSRRRLARLSTTPTRDNVSPRDQPLGRCTAGRFLTTRWF
ncbi:MAG: acyl-CoA thioesterase/BAAT N-terminal domain-containing protein [Solirubrobacterales bacterium]|nr:acyl-CoA thioesterase/BAAT N-terminal domain-containing protein [Solirubrobacterales bacterium]